MLSETLNQSLIELEQSLVEINSARNQVSSVADKSEKLIDVFTDILKKLKSIDDNLGVDKGEFKERLDDSINSLNHSLLEVSSNVSSKSNELNRQLDYIASSFSEKVELLKGNFKERLDNSFDNLNQGLLEVSSDVSSKSDELNRDLDNIVSLFSKKVESLKKGIENFNKELQTTENRIKELDLKKDLFKKIVQSQNETNDLFQQRMIEFETRLNAKNKENFKLQATEKRIGEIDLKKDLLEKIGQHQKETNELFQQKMIELETRLNAKFMGNLIGLIIGFIFLSLVVFLK